MVLIQGPADMAIHVKFFASLRERLGMAERDIETGTVATVSEVWRSATAGAEWPANILAAVNQVYATPEQAVRDGDEVAFFPPVTGG